jgi:hypothetical protein
LINTGGFPEFAIKTLFYGLDYSQRTFRAIGDGRKQNTWTSLPDVGKYVVSILLNPEMTRNQDIFVSSFTSDYISMIELLEREMGEKWTVIEETPEEQLKRGEKEHIVLMRSMLLDGRGLLDRGGYVLWNDMFPDIKPKTLAEVVKNCHKELSA